MSDQDVHDGMKIFCDWFKDRMKESDEATTWKIPLECIPNPKKVWLTVEEAKQLQEDFLDIVCEIVRLVGRYGVKYEKPDSLIILEGRIEQAEKSE